MPTYTYRCPHCGKTQVVGRVTEFRHVITCPLLTVPDDPDEKPPDQYASLIRLWKSPYVIVRGKR